jgi:hypothetical protein
MTCSGLLVNANFHGHAANAASSITVPLGPRRAPRTPGLQPVARPQSARLRSAALHHWLAPHPWGARDPVIDLGHPVELLRQTLRGMRYRG